MSLPHFRIQPSSVRDDVITLDDPREVHHALHVLRLQPGDACVAFDGAGTEYHGRIRQATAQRLTMVVERTARVERSTGLRVTLVQGLPKLPAFEAILRHATELGVARIMPVMTARSMVRLAASDWPRKRARWTRIVTEAAKQCQRADLPELCQPLRWRDWLVPARNDALLLMPTLVWSPPPLATILAAPLPSDVTLCIGPEGDFTRAEAEALVSRGGRLASLGPRTLRVETAALAALAILQHEWSKRQPQSPIT